MLKCFKVNSLKANPKMFKITILGKKSRQNVTLKINSAMIKKSAKVVLLGLTTENHITIEEYINYLCQTANYKLRTMFYVE